MSKTTVHLKRTKRLSWKYREKRNRQTRQRARIVSGGEYCPTAIDRWRKSHIYIYIYIYMYTQTVEGSEQPRKGREV